jgi:hypothetical protein
VLELHKFEKVNRNLAISVMMMMMMGTMHVRIGAKCTAHNGSGEKNAVPQKH